MTGFFERVYPGYLPCYPTSAKCDFLGLRGQPFSHIAIAWLAKQAAEKSSISNNAMSA